MRLFEGIRPGCPNPASESQPDQSTGGRVALRQAFGELVAGPLRGGGRIVQLVGEPGGELAERGHLLQAAGQLLPLELGVPFLEFLGTEALADVAEEGVGGDDLAVDDARRGVAFDRDGLSVLRLEDRRDLVELLPAHDTCMKNAWQCSTDESWMMSQIVRLRHLVLGVPELASARPD